ncbi:hypothetical protein INR49_028063, partial [Caranx melampygus]
MNDLVSEYQQYQEATAEEEGEFEEEGQMTFSTAIWPASTYTDSTALQARSLRCLPGLGGKKCSSRMLMSIGQAVCSVTSWKTRGQRLKKMGKR